MKLFSRHRIFSSRYRVNLTETSVYNRWNASTGERIKRSSSLYEIQRKYYQETNEDRTQRRTTEARRVVQRDALYAA